MSEVYYDPDSLTDICVFCKSKVNNICPECYNGILEPDRIHFVWRYSTPRNTSIKCPNKHVYHLECILNWFMYENYCVACYAELEEEYCKCCN